MLSKNVLLNWYSWMKKIEKNSNYFLRRKLTLKVEFWHFLTPPHYTLHQFSKLNNFLWVCWGLGKNLSNFVPSARKLDNLYYHNTRRTIFASLHCTPLILSFCSSGKGKNDRDGRSFMTHKRSWDCSVVTGGNTVLQFRIGWGTCTTY